MTSDQPDGLPFGLNAEAFLVSKSASAPANIRGAITCLDPVEFEATVAGIALAPEQETLVFVHESDRFWRLKGAVKSVSTLGGRGRCLLDLNEVSEIERRRCPRYPVNIPVEVGYVGEVDGELNYQVISGVATDMSLTGARLSIASLVPAQALLYVKFCVTPNAPSVRALAMTSGLKWEEHCVGIDFIDFDEDGRIQLGEFLGQLAA